MMRRAGLALIGFLVLPAGAQTPSKTGSSRPGFDVQHYDFTLRFPQRMPGTVHFVSSMRVARTGAGDRLALDLVDRFTVDSARVNGSSAATQREGNQVVVTLPAGQRDTLQVTLYYKGEPADGLVVRSDSAGTWTAFGDNFPDRARQWLATVDHPSDKATVAWTVVHPPTHRVIANGELQEESPVPGGMVTTRYASVRPLYTAVMVIGVAPFAVVELGNTACNLGELPGCVRQSVWVTPDARDYMPGPFARAGDIVAHFSRLAGPFPYEKLAHVMSSTRYGGMENAAAIFYADAMFKRRSLPEGLIAHEVAHQWFGDAVTTREWPHVWLSEGFATYFAALWTEHAHGDSAFRAELTEMRASVLNAKITNEKAVIDETLDDAGRVLTSNVYQKAGFVLHMLRREVGDSAFFRGVRAYYAKYRHSNALTADFQREVEATSKQQLGWFFDQWMRRPGSASVGVSWAWEASRKQLVLTTLQDGSGGAYRLNLSMDVTDASGRTQRVRATVPAARVSTVTVPVTVTGAVKAVALDPDVSVFGVVKVRNP